MFVALLPLAYVGAIGMQMEESEHGGNVVVHYTEAPKYYTTTYAVPSYYTEAPKYYTAKAPEYYTTTYAAPVYYTEAPKYY